MVQLIDQIAIFSQENTEVGVFMESLESLLKEHLSYHIIVVISEKTPKESIDISRFTHWAIACKKAAKSFVLVTNSISYEEAPENLSLVPTLQEAKDLIEMEEIERDLGF
ncbi:ribonuclease Z [Flavobacteriaceae bacterium]|jgi:hypothetical protein|nr:ribonuclease Z [Flavobacteriaceae bacterium]